MDDETYRKYVESELRVAVKNPLPQSEWGFQTCSSVGVEFKRSFTLLETIIALYVLMLGMVSAMALSSQSLGVAARFKQELIATNLAQEGIELVRSKRDSNYLEEKKRWGCDINVGCDANNADMKGLVDPPFTFCDQRDPNNPGGEPRGCYVDWGTTNGIVDADTEELRFLGCGIPSGSCSPLVKNTQDGFYAHGNAGGNWEETGFDRRIFIIPVTPPPDNEALIRVYVTWSDKFSANRFLILETYLTPHLL